ncbi:hypothetical protein WL76_30890 [Burkholderia ubonensis]|uniref:helix-turn-helix transcriptional regulator n=1 Tax=Burkholderia ubonensis TaxID=101571 RepID=UPI000756CAB4|nr:helix-turn-helix transcriptional regulator [Burkholderia ubonensis]KWE44593.1 hypothetical protein WL76_30890 [Burkholderia ubonensis]
MKTTVQLLDDVKVKMDLPSDYAAAKALGVTRSAVSQWRNGKATFDDDTCLLVAEILDLDPFDVLAYINIERSRDEGRRARWVHALEKFSRGFRWLALPANACGAWVPQV